jgi:hypothetical protein
LESQKEEEAKRDQNSGVLIAQKKSGSTEGHVRFEDMNISTSSIETVHILVKTNIICSGLLRRNYARKSQGYTVLSVPRCMLDRWAEPFRPGVRNTLGTYAWTSQRISDGRTQIQNRPHHKLQPYCHTE